MKKIIKSRDTKKERITTFVASAIFFGIGVMLVVSGITNTMEPASFPAIGIASSMPKLIELFGWKALACFSGISCMIISMIGFFNSFFEFSTSVKPQ